MQTAVPRAAHAALLLGYLLTRAWMLASSHYSDVATWFHRLSRESTLPEYGPLATVIARAPLWLGVTTLTGYVWTARLMALAADLVLTWLVMRRTSWTAAMAFLVGSGLLHDLWLDRMDLYVALFVVVAMGSSLAWMLGAALIKFPFIALAWVPFLRSREWRAAGPTVAFVVVVLLGGWLLGPDTFFTPLGFHAARGLQREGLWGNLIDVGRVALGWPCHVVSGSGSPDIQCAGQPWLPWLGRLTLLLGVLVTAVATVVTGVKDSLPRAMLLAVVAYTAFNPVGSPQFAVVVLALAPFALDAHRREDRLSVGLLLFYALMTERAFARWGLPGFEALTLARNLSLLGVWTVLMVRR